ncbi:MAG: CsiV family protein [Pseudomonadales bacterium]|jgi:hypothetical protein
MGRRLLLLGLALLPTLARSETFDIEVLFVEPLAALAITEEQLPLRKAAELPAQALRFDAPRPANPGQAKALWDSIGQGPTLRWVTPGLSPEVDDFLDQLTQLRSLEGRGLETLQSIQTLRWAGTPGPPRPLAFFLAPEGRSVPAFGLQQAPALTPALALREAGADDFERWRPLTARELRFGGARRTLARSAEFGIVGHFGWRAVLEENEPTLPLALWLPESEETPGLTGSLGVDLRRFLHLSGTVFLREGNGWLEIPLARRMRSEELHHIDHPRLAVLIEVRPVDP